MQIYHYHPTEREFTGVGMADASPLETNVWLIPANATTIAPPESINGKIRVFVDGKWSYDDIPTPHDIPPPTDEELLQMQIREIQRELENLDQVVPRILEDIIAQSTFVIHQSKLDIIARKVILREQLSNLSTQ
jgi:hypothetical protein